MNLAMVIVNWNTPELLADCMRSMYEAAVEPDLEIPVVDDAAIDGTATVVRASFPQVHVIESAENVGSARANNQPIRQSWSPGKKPTFKKGAGLTPIDMGYCDDLD